MSQLAGRYTAGMSADMNYKLEQGFVPFLPDDVALQCLLRVPVQSHAQLQGVCRKWRDLVNSAEFYEHRKKEGTTGSCVCLLQALPRTNPEDPPFYSVSVLNGQNSWERLPPIPNLTHQGLPLFCRFAAGSGKLVVLGGWDPTTWETLRSVYVFNFSTWTWRTGAQMPTTRSFFACGAIGNHVVVAGGHDNNKNALSSAELYNLAADRWQTLPRMNEQRDECSGAVLDGKFYVISGYRTSMQGEFMRDAEVYDPEENSWREIEEMWALGSKAVSPSGIVVASGSLFAFYENQLVCYSPENNVWEFIDSVPEGEEGISAPVCATAFGNTIIVTGPRNAEDASYRTLLYKLPSGGSSSQWRCRGKWEMVPVDEQFLGIAQVSCVVEI